MKERLVKNWTNGLNITTEAIFIQRLDTEHLAKQKLSIVRIPIQIGVLLKKSDMQLISTNIVQIKLNLSINL